MNKVLLILSLVAASVLATSPLIAQPVDLFQTRVHGFNQGNRNLDIRVFNADGTESGYYHDLQCSIVYWADGDTTFPFTLTYDPATREVSWVVDTPDSGMLTTASPTTPPAHPVNNLHLYVRATAGASVQTCNAVPYVNCQAGGWDCNVSSQVDASAVHLTNLQLDGLPLADLSVSAGPADPEPLASADVEVDPGQAWTLTGNVRFTWLSANGYPPKEARILFSAVGQYVPCIDEDEDGYCVPADCDDSNAAVYPGAFEAPYGDPVCTDGIDNNCNGYTDAEDAGCAAGGWALGESADASVYGAPSREDSNLTNLLFALLLPAGTVVLLRRVFSRK